MQLENSCKRMEKTLVKFVNFLRSTGIRVSTAEAVDALVALNHIDIMDKNSFRVALQSMLIKEEEQIAAYNAAFNIFFTTPEEKQKQQQHLEDEKDKKEQLLTEAEKDLSFQEETLKFEEEERLLYSSLDEERKGKLQEFLQKSSAATHHNPEKFKSVLENLVRQHLKYWKANSDYLTPLPTEETGDVELDAALTQLNTLDPREKNLLYRDMQSLTNEDLPEAKKVIKMLSKKLLTKISRSYRSSKKRRGLDFRATVRKNLSHGGTPLKLRYKSRRIKKSQVVILCDVSGSMNRYSAFVTSFIYNLSAAIKRMDIFLFSEEVEKLGTGFLKEDNYEETVFKIIENSRVWGKGTNLAKALAKVTKRYPEAFTRKTLVIIISDTKTLAVEEAARKLQKLRGNVKEVIFLNTLPEKEWQGKHSVEALRKSSIMYPCNTLADLKRLAVIWKG